MNLSPKSESEKRAMSASRSLTPSRRQARALSPPQGDKWEKRQKNTSEPDLSE